MPDTTRHLAITALLLLAGTQSALANDHADLLGTWSWSMPRPACQITRTFSADGTTQVVNGGKKTSGTFVVKANRERTARQLIYTVTSDDGGTDCDGSTHKTVGARYLSYVDVSGSSLRMCLDAAKSSCLGPYRRR
jgi:hypothetical protein